MRHSLTDCMIFVLCSAEEQKLGGRFLHMFLQDGYPGARLGCSGSDVLKVLSSPIIENNTVVRVIVR